MISDLMAGYGEKLEKIIEDEKSGCLITSLHQSMKFEHPQNHDLKYLMGLRSMQVSQWMEQIEKDQSLFKYF